MEKYENCEKFKNEDSLYSGVLKLVEQKIEDINLWFLYRYLDYALSDLSKINFDYSAYAEYRERIIKFYPEDSLKVTMAFLSLYLLEEKIAGSQELEFSEDEHNYMLFSKNGIGKEDVKKTMKYFYKTILENKKQESEKYFNREIEAVDVNKQQAKLPFYLLLKNYPTISNFINKINPKYKEELFEELDEYYKEANQCSCGYLRFKLLYFMEFDTRLELHYRLLKKLKGYKSSWNMNKEEVREELERFGGMHRVPRMIASLIADKSSTINTVCFDIDKYVDAYYCKGTSKAKKEDCLTSNEIRNAFMILNDFISDTSKEIADEIFDKYSEKSGCELSYKKFFELTNGEGINRYFNEYLDAHQHYELNKNVRNDITLMHFKTLYKFRKTKNRNQ